MSDVVPFDTVTAHTLKRLNGLVDELEIQASAPANARVQLLASAYLRQMRELYSTVERIVTKVSDRALRRPLPLPSTLPPPTTPADHALEGAVDDSTVDSTTLTAWLIAELNTAGTLFQHLADQRRLGPCSAAVTELAALFPAQSRRVAMEAHRFNDL